MMPLKSQIYPMVTVEVLRNFGPQPVSSRFVKNPSTSEFLQEMSLALCPASGLVQLVQTFPSEELRPRVPWITAFEPETHLDELTALLTALPGLSLDSIVAGYSSKDDSTLQRLKDRGFKHQWRLDPALDLGLSDPCVFVESFQLPFCDGAAARAAERRGRPHLFLVRHVLEHSYDILRFLRSAADVIRDDGYVMFEVPDCTRAFEAFDYTTLWEEHSVYFTPWSFLQALSAAGFEPLIFENYPHSFENCMVAVCRKTSLAKTSPPSRPPESELSRALHFASEFPRVTANLHRHLEGLKSQGKRMALFGAGHLAVAFLSLHGLADYFECVIDDNPYKEGMLLPGSRLPIKCSKALIDDQIHTCLLSLNPESEEKVIQKNASFTKSGGHFLSIFPSSERYFAH